MSSKIIYITFILVNIFSCRGVDTKLTTEITSDTTLVLDLALRTAFIHDNLPSIDALRKQYHFGDSILFSSDTLPLSILPRASDTINFKILSHKEIVLLMQTESNLNKIPNYLNIGAFEKSDTGYYVSVQSLNCLDFGGGGQIGLYIVKAKDSFLVVNKMSSNIN
ncbi:MAG: hypothetical protein ABIN67_04565 [Ferruginibacter sp.]